MSNHILGILVCFVLLSALFVESSHACRRTKPFSISEMVTQADLIVHAVADTHIRLPKGKASVIPKPDGIIEFVVIDVIKGEHDSPTITLPGFLGKFDDYNDQPPPYTFVRKAGSGGDCCAHEYKEKGEFLLILKRIDQEYTACWYVLGPTNEQVRGDYDPWIMWIRGYVAGLENLTTK